MTEAETESDFEKTLALIGGRHGIYLVSDVIQSRAEAGDKDEDVLQEFIRVLFQGGKCLAVAEGRHLCAANNSSSDGRQDEPGDVGAKRRGKTARRRASSSSLSRTIDFPTIMFLFRQSFISCDRQQVRLKEILKDVRARTKRAGSALPALIGLVRTKAPCAETQKCVELLDLLLRSVFRKHAPETIWAGSFVPSAPSSLRLVKSHFCAVVRSSPAADFSSRSRNPLLQPFLCWFRPSGGAHNTSSSSTQRGNVEESIPLKNNSTSAGPNEESAG
ncbi:uncharacterized protein C2orf72 [Entelurus aequoreus]|uniref:uncharacterized protein C2orf72 n=1 Tax=Entelurus aequoreus TaxID=161455 RepID=UPI002B1E4449|nr:uncharacterized protein C2orf72 [Entelurus aequoreus]